MKKRMPVLLALLLLSSCAGAPEGVSPITGLDLNRYLGTWYEIARLDHRFERGLMDVTATYSLRDGGGVKVVNRGYNVEKGEWEEAVGKAFSTGASDVGQFKVSFFGPFYGGYNIFELDKTNYEYALVAGDSRSYLWILARSPDLPEETIASLVEIARGLDFPVDDLIYVTHDTEN